MKLAIVGLGGVGGHYGARLARRYAGGQEGVEVYFVARGEHLRRIQADGLRFSSPDESFVARPTAASDQPAGWGELDLILFCVKTYSLEESAAQMRANLGARTVLISALNGVDNAERLRAIFPGAALLNGGVYISAMQVGPGEVRQIGGTGKIFFGWEPASGQPAPEHARFRALVDVFQAAGIPAEYDEDVRPAVWEKYLFISPLASAGTALRQNFGELRSDPKSWALLDGLLGELEAVAAALGVRLPENIHASTLNKALGFPPDTKTSMQVDAERGKPLEMETLTGYVVRAAHRLGVPAPLYEEMYQRLKPA